MSASKAHSRKREAPPPTIVQLHAAKVHEAWPVADAILQEARARWETARIHASRMPTDWQQAKQTGLRALQACSNEWIAHRGDLVTGAKARALYADAFGPAPLAASTDGTQHQQESAHVSSALRTLQSAGHRAAVRSAEAHIQTMRDAMQKMAGCVHTLLEHLLLLQDCWNQLYTATSVEGLPAPSSFDEVALRPDVDDDAVGAPPTTATTALGALTLSRMLPTDVALGSTGPTAPTSTINLPQALRVLTVLHRMYTSDLHTKAALVDALAKMIASPPTTATSSASASSSSFSLLRSPADEFGCQAQLARSGHVDALTMYIATWMMEPDIASEITMTSAHLLQAA